MEVEGKISYWGTLGDPATPTITDIFLVQTGEGWAGLIISQTADTPAQCRHDLHTAVLYSHQKVTGTCQVQLTLVFLPEHLLPSAA